MLKSMLPNFGISSLFKQSSSLLINQVRTRISCSRTAGKEKSVKTAMARFFRLDKRVWIHAAPGYHGKLWRKPTEKRYLLQQFYLTNRPLSRTLERMAGKYYKRFDIRKIVDKPFSLYHPFLKKQEKKFFP